MSNSMKNFFIGLFLIGSIGALFGVVLFLKPSVGDEKQVLYLRFSNINKINIGTRVLFAGKAVGEVVSIDEIDEARKRPQIDELGRLFFYQLTLKIDSNVRVYNTDIITIQTSGLLGEKSIAIVPRASPDGVIPDMITDKTPFYANSVDAIENTFARLSDVGEKLDGTVDRIRQWVEQNGNDITELTTSFASVIKKFDKLTQAVDQEEIVPQLKEGMTGIVNLFKVLGGIADSLKSGIASFDQTFQEITGGQGTLGKLIQEDEVHFRLTTFMSKINDILSYIKKYGFLFHLNKNWQRTYLKPMTILNALDDSASFKEYCETEMEQINGAIDRLALLIDRAKKEQNDDWLNAPQFQKNIGELIYQFNKMTENLRFCNKRLAEEPYTEVN